LSVKDNLHHSGICSWVITITALKGISCVLIFVEVVTHGASAGMLTWLIESDRTGRANMLTADDLAVAEVVVGRIVVDVSVTETKSKAIMARTR
jgi:cell division inhibitor SulA